METKMFEVRDVGTHIVVVATAIKADLVPEKNLLRACGYDATGNGSYSLILTKINTTPPTSHCDAYSWGSRTMTHAHLHIAKEFFSLPTGSVVDVAYLLGERDKPARSSNTEGF
jgi:hypothetical protein